MLQFIISRLRSDKIYLVFLLCLVLLAFILRIVRIDNVPPRLTQDEMSIGYNAYSILKTGKDEWGRTMPLVFEAFGDFKLPAYIYASIPSILILGLTPLAVKIPSLIAGCLLVIVMYLLTLQITRNKASAILAALVLTISPWPVHLSRMALESNIALLFFTLHLLFLLKAWQTQKKAYAILAGISLGITWYSYIAYRLIICVFGIGVASFGFFYKHRSKQLLLTAATFLLIAIPVLTSTFNNAGTARFRHISMFNDIGVDAEVNENRAYCFLNDTYILPKICPLFFNKPQVYVSRFIKSYTKTLTSTFLFIDGDEVEYLNNPRFGEFAILFLPFYVWGLIYWLKKPGFEANVIKLGFFTSPIPLALVGDPQIVRGSALIPFVSLFIAVGLKDIFDLLKRKHYQLAFTILVAGIGLFTILRFTLHYWFVYPGKYDNAAYPISPEIALYIKDNEARYQTIYINQKFPDPHILFAFYQKMDPKWYQENVIRPNPDALGFSHPTRIGKYIFENRNLDSLLCDPTAKGALYLTDMSENLPTFWTYYNFAGVHVQAKLYDVDALRGKLFQEGSLFGSCPNLKQATND